MRAQAIIVAAGQSTRFGASRPKQLQLLAGRPLFVWSVEAFQRASTIESVVLVVPRGAEGEFGAILERYALSEGVEVVPGGAERVDSVERGIAALDPEAVLVAVHDAARALIEPALIDRVIEAAAGRGAAIAALPARDTVKESQEGLVVQTLDRERIWLAQTPQAARIDWLKDALARRAESIPTDEAQLLEAAGYPVELVEGAPENFKVTIPREMALAEKLCASRTPRVGIGHDVHRLVEGRPLILGGVTVPFERGLEGHSDADVLAHAVGDALLGAACLGDLGAHFPPSDPRFAGADSIELLTRINGMVREAGYEPRSVDSVVICERPRLAPYIPEMRQRLAAALGLSRGAVSVKATTTEALGFTGRGEGVAAQATAVIV